MTICKNQFTTDAYAEMQKRIGILMVDRTFLNIMKAYILKIGFKVLLNL